jgi:hypothetical protein
MRFSYRAFRSTKRRSKCRSQKIRSQKRGGTTRKRTLRKQRGGKSAAMIPDTTLDYLEEQAVIVPTGVEGKNQYEGFELKED